MPQEPMKEVKPVHLIPAPEIRNRIINNDRKREPLSPFWRFMKRFFMGEGY